MKGKKMSKKTCFIIFLIALGTILVSYLLNFVPVIRETNMIFAQMQNVYIAVSAIVLALVLAKNKYYWLIMLALALIVAALIQVLIAGGTVMSVAVLYKAIAFMVYAYLITLARFML